MGNITFTRDNIKILDSCGKKGCEVVYLLPYLTLEDKKIKKIEKQTAKAA